MNQKIEVIENKEVGRKKMVSFLRRKRQQENKRSYPLFFKPLEMLIGQGMSRLTARYCLSFLILTKDLSTHLAFISNLSYFYVRKRIFIRHSGKLVSFCVRKRQLFFFHPFILNIFHFISFFTFSCISLFVSLQITTHLTFRTYCPERHARNRTIPDGGTV